MKRKLISKTYLKDVTKYNLNIHYHEDNYYLSVKKIIEIREPFIPSTGKCLINNGYYIVEVIPKNENYAMRVFFNEKKERLEYYFDITLENGLDEETKIPYYDDLYLDVIMDNEKMEVLDADELEEALNDGIISKDDFDLANKTKDLLIESIRNKTNQYVKLDLENYLA